MLWTKTEIYRDAQKQHAAATRLLVAAAGAGMIGNDKQRRDFLERAAKHAEQWAAQIRRGVHAEPKPRVSTLVEQAMDKSEPEAATTKQRSKR